MISALQTLPESVRRTEAGLGVEIGEAAKRLTDALATIGADFAVQQKSMMGAVTDFNARVADIPNIVSAASRDSAATVGASVEASLGRISEITAKAGEASAKQLSDEVATIAASLAASAQSLRSASEDSAKNISHAGALLGTGIRDGIKTVEETSLKSSKDLAETISSLSNVVNGLASRLDQTTKLLETQQANLAQAGIVVSNASTSLSNSAGNVERAVSPLAGAVAAIRAAMDQVVAASAQLRDTSASEQKIAEMLNGTVDRAGAAFAQQAERFGALQNGVRETMVGLVNGVSQLANEINKCIEVYDSAIARSIGGLENAILEMSDSVRPDQKVKAN
jgi:chromosome segregation ATPase